MIDANRSNTNKEGALMKYDCNALEHKASELIGLGRFMDAAKIYLFMADSDSSLDGGYLALKIGQCYASAGDLHAAKYWYGRAVEENPSVDKYVEARRSLEYLNIDELISPKDNTPSS
jgi:tetratricopeptide (TPR) repeat protein